MPIKVQGTEVVTNDRKLINLDGAGVSGIVTSLVAGTGINISGATGQVTISNTYTNSAGFTSVANSTLDLNGDGAPNIADSLSFISGCIPTQVSIANTTNTAGLTFTEGDILYAYTGAQQYSGSFSLFTRNSTYPYADNYINAAPTAGMSFGAKHFSFFRTKTNGNDIPQASIELSSNGNLNFVYDDNVKIQAGAGCSITTGSGNVFIGGYSGYKTNTGLCNVAIGCYSFSENTAGTYNISIGVLAANTVPNGIGNIFLGSSAGEFANYGVDDNYNINIGAGAGRYSGCDGGITRRNINIGAYAGSEVSGSNNINIGNCASLFSSHGGFGNIVVGNGAACIGLGQTSCYNVIIGESAGTFAGSDTLGVGPAQRNVLIGQGAGGTLLSGYCNVFIGNSAGLHAQETRDSIAIGSSAGFCNYGVENVIIGCNAGFGSSTATSTGSCNVFMGKSSGYKNTTGSDNIFIGSRAGYSNTSTSYNILIGRCAGYGQTGTDNVFIGDNVGKCVFYSCRNTFLGPNVAWLADGGTNNVAIGYQAATYLAVNSTSNIVIGPLAGATMGQFGNPVCYNIGIGPSALGGTNDAGSDCNTAIGPFAGQYLEGVSSIAIGHSAGYCNSGDCNILIGNSAGFNNEGTENVFIGNKAGYGNTTSNNSISLGCYAGFCNAGESNIYIGESSGYMAGRTTTVTGSHNISIGQSAGGSLSLGCDNVAIGRLAGSSMTQAFGNIMVGLCAGKSVTGASYNTVMGNHAFRNITSGSGNTIIGSNVMDLGTDLSQYNIIIGYYTARSLEGSNNIIFGRNAGGSGDINDSIAIGQGSGRLSISSCNNVFIGKCAGMSIGSSVNGTGNDNVSIGTSSGSIISSGSNNILIGKHAGNVTLTPSGLKSITTTSNNIVIGNADITNFYTKMAATGSGGNAVCWNGTTYELYSASSSARYKENIRPFLSGVKELVEIEPVTFTYIDRPDEPEQIGFIAEQLDEIGLTHFVNYDKDNRPDSVSYDRVIVLAINAIKELNNENQELKLRITQLENVVGISSSGSN